MAVPRDPAPARQAPGTPLTTSNAPRDNRRGIAVGQRYVSDAEPELGLGLVVAVDERVVHLAFPAADETRRYVVGSAPVRRVRFAAGDTLADNAGQMHRVQGVEERDGVVYYACDIGELAESRVAAGTAVAGPRERLAAGRVDASSLFELRVETLARLHEIRSSPVRGLAGPRIELLPHQFFVAAETSSRLVPRVLLADETGLGKTIEAGLILSRLVLAGRAARVLVLVPDSLVHQWLVELRRRFQLRFAVYDEARCAAFEDSEPGSNPFAQEQLVLAGLSLLTTKRTRRGAASRTAQAAEAAWDIVVVDEAHHLEWSREHASAEYVAVETIARRSTGLLLLTATPEQLGAEGHFARLRLLDPDRYGDYDAWNREAQGYREAARLAGELMDDGPLPASSESELAEVLGMAREDVARRVHDPRERSRLLAELIDRHGPGRVMFRNTRAAVRGFPQREVHRYALAPKSRGGREDDAALLQRLGEELAADLAARAEEPRYDDFADVDADAVAEDTDAPAIEDDGSEAAVAAPSVLEGDPRIEWLVNFLAPNGPRKVLLICSSGVKAAAIESALAARIRVTTALFHEGLTLLQRDRNAAWFAETDGARLMICSELGSEGRNFQHAQHLVLFDVPLDPDLVEQRIGRLDRIGQRGIVEVHAPFVTGSGFEVLLRWLDEGVNALRQPTMAAHALLERFAPRVRELALGATGTAELTRAVDELVADTVAASAELVARVEKGRDRLLEMASLRRDVAEPLIEAVRALDTDTEFEDYFLRLLEHFHVYAEEVEPRRYLLNPDGTRSPEFPSLDHGESVLTFDRETALVREDLIFATRDHPLLGDAMEALLAAQSGNAAFAILDDAVTPRLWLEALFVLEPVAPPRLHADRFLAPTPIRVILDQHLREAIPGASGDDPTAVDLFEGGGTWIAGNRNILAPLITRMAARCDELAEARAIDLRTSARAEMDARLGAELERLDALAAVNDHVRADEAPALEAERAELARAIDGARLRPDSMRLVWQGPTKDGAPLLKGGRG
ncbi:MAG: RNA polymerase-associated protein RapA [Candidatus Binatia bacterium]